MGIQVECPNGHHFKVKDKYAGKKGLCPHCEGQVVIRVPDALTSVEANRNYRRVVAEEVRNKTEEQARAKATREGIKAKIKNPNNDSSVLDDTLHDDPSSSCSLLNSSIIQHNVKCSCGQAVPMWFARCPGCGKFMQGR